MKSLLVNKNSFKSVLLIFWLLVPTLLIAQDFPEPLSPPRLVNDFAEILSDAQERQLEQKLLLYNDSTSTEVAIVTMNSIGQYETMDYGIKLFNKWKVGKEGKNNGILILVAVNDRQMGIVTGYGVEGAVPDAATYTIRENYMKPAFKQGNYYKGLNDATTIIFDLLKGEYTAEQLVKQNKGGYFGLIVILFMIIIWIISIKQKQKHFKEHHVGGANLSFWATMLLMSSMSNRGSGYGNFRGGSGSFGGGGGGFGGFGGGFSGGGGSAGGW
jgi:uncharacterized protein